MDTVNGFIALVTRQTERFPLVIPGLESYFDGHPVTVFESGRRLLEKLSQPTPVLLPHLIVLDLSRSVEGELDFLRVLKAEPRFRSIPVLMRKITSPSWVLKPISKSEKALLQDPKKFLFAPRFVDAS